MSQKANTFIIAFFTSFIVSVGTYTLMQFVIFPMMVGKTAPVYQVPLPRSVSRLLPTRSVRVPRLRNLSRRKATAKLRSLGLRVGKVSVAYDEDVGPFVVLRQSPRAGSTVQSGTRVNLVINKE